MIPGSAPTIRIREELSIAELQDRCRHSGYVYFGANTPWFSDRIVYTVPKRKVGAGIPCDLRGGMLLQTDKPDEFFERAKEDPSHYGQFGLRAFCLAFHGCVVVGPDNLPTCLDNWDQYNGLLGDYMIRELP